MAAQAMHPVWGLSMRALRRSLYANQVLSSVVHEWTAIDSLRALTSNAGIAAAVDDSGAKRNTAIGHIVRLHFVPAAVTEEVGRLTPLVVKELTEIRAVDENVEALLQMLAEEGKLPETWYQLALLWSGEQRRWLRVARRTLRDAMDEDVWMEGKQFAKGAQPSEGN